MTRRDAATYTRPMLASLLLVVAIGVIGYGLTFAMSRSTAIGRAPGNRHGCRLAVGVGRFAVVVLRHRHVVVDAAGRPGGAGHGGDVVIRSFDAGGAS